MFENCELSLPTGSQFKSNWKQRKEMQVPVLKSYAIVFLEIHWNGSWGSSLWWRNRKQMAVDSSQANGGILCVSLLLLLQPGGDGFSWDSVVRSMKKVEANIQVPSQKVLLVRRKDHRHCFLSSFIPLWYTGTKIASEANRCALLISQTCKLKLPPLQINQLKVWVD